MSSCERPSNSSGSDFGPPSVANLYSFSTGTQGSSRRCSSTRFACFSSSRSAASSCLRATCHSCSVPTFIGPPSRDLVLIGTVRRRKTHRKAEGLEQLRPASQGQPRCSWLAVGWKSHGNDRVKPPPATRRNLAQLRHGRGSRWRDPS